MWWGDGAYDAPCRFYDGGPVGIIRWYHVPETNQVYTGKTAFEPQWPVLEWENTDGVGEITGGRRKYYRGFNRNLHPELDGSHPCGTEAQFRGLGKPPLAGGYVRAEDLPQCVWPGFHWFAESDLIVTDATVVVDGPPVGLPFYWSGEGDLVADGVPIPEDMLGVGDLVLAGVGVIEDVWAEADLVLDGVTSSSLGGELLLDSVEPDSDLGGELLLDSVEPDADFEGELTLSDASEIT